MVYTKRQINAVRRRIERFLIEKDLTFADIGRSAGTSRQSVHKRFHDGLDTPEKIDFFATHMKTPFEDLCPYPRD